MLKFIIIIANFKRSSIMNKGTETKVVFKA